MTVILLVSNAMLDVGNQHTARWRSAVDDQPAAQLSPNRASTEAPLDCFIRGVLASSLFSFISILWFCQKMAEPTITMNAAARFSKNAARANATHATAIIVIRYFFSQIPHRSLNPLVYHFLAFSPKAANCETITALLLARQPCRLRLFDKLSPLVQSSLSTATYRWFYGPLGIA